MLSQEKSHKDILGRVRRKLFGSVAALSFLGFMGACSHIDEAERYIDTGEVYVARNVLLEEFTGQFCPNCPEGHQVIESLEEQYGESLIVVSIHAGYFGVMEPQGLMTPTGNAYAERWNIDTYPSGVVDRITGPLGRSAWSNAVRNEIGRETTLQLSLTADLSDDGNIIEVFTTLATTSPMSGALQLWIVENDIVTFQQDGGTILPAYVHNNVFRAAINGVWGQEIPLASNHVEYVSNTIEVNPAWNLDNVYIVGFYYNSGVEQVERIRLIPHEEDTENE